VPVLNGIADATYQGSQIYSDVVHFVHVYIIEPHPASPDPSPYSGVVWEEGYSSMSQPLTYDERVTNALDMLPSIQGDQLLLVDDLTPGEMNNPVWCTYGPCPNCAFLIGQDGVVDTVQLWVGANIESAIDALLQ
jgi:hypothetical protein